MTQLETMWEMLNKLKKKVMTFTFFADNTNPRYCILYLDNFISFVDTCQYLCICVLQHIPKKVTTVEILPLCNVVVRAGRYDQKLISLYFTKLYRFRGI